MDKSRERNSPDQLSIVGDQLVIGDWQADLSEVVAAGAEIRVLLREERTEDARALLQGCTVARQVALVSIDEKPEEILSLTGMDASGVPAYRQEVVDHLPSPVLCELVAPNEHRMVRFNSTLLATMSPQTLQRTVDDSLDPVLYHVYRGQVSWEWLEAIASLGDTNRIAQLLSAIDVSVLEDALIPRVDDVDMNATIAGNGVSVSAFRSLAEDSAGLTLPPLRDPESAAIIQALHQAAPELIAQALRQAWERAGAL